MKVVIRSTWVVSFWRENARDSRSREEVRKGAHNYKTPDLSYVSEKFQSCPESSKNVGSVEECSNEKDVSFSISKVSDTDNSDSEFFTEKVSYSRSKESRECENESKKSNLGNVGEKLASYTDSSMEEKRERIFFEVPRSCEASIDVRL